MSSNRVAHLATIETENAFEGVLRGYSHLPRHKAQSKPSFSLEDMSPARRPFSSRVLFFFIARPRCEKQILIRLCLNALFVILVSLVRFRGTCVHRSPRLSSPSLASALLTVTVSETHFVHRLHHLVREPSTIILLRTLDHLFPATLLTLLLSAVFTRSVGSLSCFTDSDFRCAACKSCGDDAVDFSSGFEARRGDGSYL